MRETCMGNKNNNVLIENENLFRAVTCAPFGVAFSFFAVNAMQSTGPVLLKVIFILMALYFSLSALAYAAYYTNDLFHEEKRHEISNVNLFKTLFYAPIAILFVLVALDSVMSSGHVFFKVSLVLLASYATLKALAHAAYYTNDYHAIKAVHAS